MEIRVLCLLGLFFLLRSPSLASAQMNCACIDDINNTAITESATCPWFGFGCLNGGYFPDDVCRKQVSTGFVGAQLASCIIRLQETATVFVCRSFEGIRVSASIWVDAVPA